MNVLLIICLIILIISSIIFVLLSWIKIEILYKRSGENDILTVTIKYLKYLKFSIHVPKIDVGPSNKGFGFKLMSSIIGDFEKKLNIDTLNINTIIDLLKKSRKFFKEYKDINKFLEKKTIVEKIDSKIDFGMLDPAATGFVTGLMYSSIYSFFAFLSHKVRINSFNIKILPNYNDLIFNIYFFCIFKIRIGNIIYVVLKMHLISLLLYILIKSDLTKVNTNMR